MDASSGDQESYIITGLTWEGHDYIEAARHAATEFFRLGVEIGMTLDAARTLRDAAKSGR